MPARVQATRRVAGRGLTTALLAATGVAGLAAGSVLAAAGYVAQQLTYVPRGDASLRYGFTPWELGVTYEDVCFSAEDGATLRGWLLTRPESRRAIVCLAGYRGQRSDVLGASAALWRAGYNVLLFDYRGHGDSDGTRITLGHNETSDFRAALGWLRQRLPGVWIGVLGYSMGGAVAIMGAAHEPDVRAVATDCAFARQEEVVRIEWRRRLRAPSTPFVEVANHLLARLHGFRFADVEPLRLVGRIAPRPLLIIHATADTIVPVGDAFRLYEAAGEPKELWIIEDVPHCGGYFADRVAYMQRLIAFFDRAAAAAAGADRRLTPGSLSGAEDLHRARPGGIVGAAL